MNIWLIQRMRSDFDSLARTLPSDGSIEFWFARDLQEPLDYARWENFMTAIHRAIESYESTCYKPEHHFRGVTKMVVAGCENSAWRCVQKAFHKRIAKNHLIERYQLVTFSHASEPPP